LASSLTLQCKSDKATVGHVRHLDAFGQRRLATLLDTRTVE
jgi:hypothetical protein